jgi:hypothetical protein
MTVITAGVGHEHAEKRGANARSRANCAEIEGTERADAVRVAKPGRESLSIVGGEGHENAELLIQVLDRHFPVPPFKTGVTLTE